MQKGSDIKRYVEREDQVRIKAEGRIGIFMEAKRDCLIEYNGLYKENDELYRNAARVFGLSDCAFWILYSLRECDRELKQSDICSAIYLPKQTVNSSLKKLEQEGIIELTAGADRRSRFVRLTRKGIDLAAKSVDAVLAAEQRALGKMKEEEQAAFLGLFRKYTDLLKNEMGAFINEKS